MPLEKDGFFNLIFFNLSKKLEAVFIFGGSLGVGVEIGSGVFCITGAASLGVSVTGVVVGSGVFVGCSAFVVSAVTGGVVVSFSLFA